MPSIVERIRSFVEMATKSAQTQAPYASAVGSMTIFTAHQRGVPAGRRMLRDFADTSEPVRTAINWRKQQVAQSRSRIVRVDDPRKPPDPRVVKAAAQLFNYINPKGESFRSLMDQVVEDLIVLDAGCIEIEQTIGGKPNPNTGCAIAALWAVDGGTIAPDPTWDGRDQKAIRYRQWIDGKLVAELRNDQLVYMMQTPTTHRLLGLSQVEILVRAIEASLFGEKYASELLRQAAPPGMLYLGGGLSDQQIQAFRAYYQSEVAGKGRMAIGGGGTGPPPEFVKFAWAPKDLLFDEYRQWLINMIAFVFQIDKTIFGLVDDVNRSTSKTMSARTDQGFVSLARLVAEYVTREIISKIDPDHGFEFLDLVVTDPLVQAKIDQVYGSIGVLTPNEIRAERFGLDPVEWGDAPYNAAGSPTPDPLSEDQPEDGETSTPSNDETQQQDGGKKHAVPAIAPGKPTTLSRARSAQNAARLRYLAHPTVSNAEAWERAHDDVAEVAKRGRPFGATAAPAATPQTKSGYLGS
jgi:hypothetical protein